MAESSGVERDTGESIDIDETADGEDDSPRKGVRRGLYPTDRLQGSPRANFAGAGRGRWARN